MQLNLTKPGLFIAGTDTDVGKTVITCAIAAVLRQRGMRVGVCKPIATGCVNDTSADAVALRRAAGCDLPLTIVNPVRYTQPLAPAVAAELENRPVDVAAISAALHRLDAASDIVLVEGIGGVMVPIDAHRTVVDLIRDIGYPVLVVTRPNLGTLNHTALTIAALRAAGLPVAGLIVNRYGGRGEIDLAQQTSPEWIARMSGLPILARVPDVGAVAADVPGPVLDAMSGVDWASLARSPR